MASTSKTENIISIRLKQTASSDVPTPPASDFQNLFLDLSDGAVKKKLSDGSLQTLGGGVSVSSLPDLTDVDSGLTPTASDYLYYDAVDDEFIILRNNFSASSAPTTSDDSGSGYAVGSLWIDVSNDKAYQCVDPGSGAAVWLDLTAASSVNNLSDLGDVANGLSPTDADYLYYDNANSEFISLKNNFGASSAPTTSNDTGEGYVIGSLWIDTTNDKVYQCVDASSGAAVWIDLSDTGSGGASQLTDLSDVSSASDTANFLLATPDGTNGDYSGRALVVGDIPNLPASQITSGTLVHQRGGLEADVSAYGGVPLISGGTTSEIKYNRSATSAPTTSDDSGQGYSVASRWIDTTNDEEYVCLDASAGAAVWANTSGLSGTTGSTDNALLRANGTGGFEVQGSSATLSDTGVLSVATLSLTNDLTIANGGTGASTASGARSNLGLVIGTQVQAYSSNLDDFSSKSAPAGAIVGTTDSQTLTNKTVSDVFIYSGDIPMRVTPQSSEPTSPSTNDIYLDDGTNTASGVVGWRQYDGASWQDIGATSGGGGGGGLYTAVAVIGDEKTSGTDGGATTATSWNARDLNTEIYDPDNIVSISLDQFILDAGTYDIYAEAVGYSMNSHKIRVYDVTNAAVVDTGMSNYSKNETDAIPTLATIACRVTPASSTAYRIDHYSTIGGSNTLRLGRPVSDGSPERYLTIIIKKVT